MESIPPANVAWAQESIPRNQFCSLAGRYDNPIPTWFLSTTDCLKIPALAGRYDNHIPTRFLAPIDCLKIPAQVPCNYCVPMELTTEEKD